MANSAALVGQEKHDDVNYLAFVNILSQPILLVNLKGEVFLKNDAFLKHPSNTMLNTLGLVELSDYLKASLSPIRFPLEENAKEYRSTLEYRETQRHFISLHPFVFPDTHVIAMKTYDNEDLLQRVLDCIPARVFWKDVNSKFMGGNHLFLSDCGLSNSEQLIGLGDHDVFSREEAEAYITDDKKVMYNGHVRLNTEEPQTRSDGEVNWLQTTKVPIRNDAQDIIGVMGSYTDITERKIYQQMIEQQARHDQLTKLHNRQALQEYLQKLETETRNEMGCLLFIDLDNFKTVNDTLGHALGDALLKNVSIRIQECVEKTGFIARIGGDEFAILLLGQPGGQSEDVVEKGDRVASDIKKSILDPFCVESHYIQLGVSIGITYFCSAQIDWANTFNEADLAMYDAKASGKNKVAVFTEGIREKHNYIYKMQTLLNTAIENNEFYIKIQPQFDGDKTLIGGEALLRWNNPELGEVSPVEFIPISEQSGTIHEIGKWVFEHAFSLVSTWQQKHGRQFRVPLAVNLSAKQFQSADFMETIENLMTKYDVEPGAIHIELTESLLLENEADAIDKLKSLTDLGFPLALDDFGTGYSCLSYLNRLPIKKIKIDKGFTFKVVEDAHHAMLVQTIITMADKLKMNVIAEGVENEDQLAFLRENGCNEFQGYFFSKPIDYEEYETLLSECITSRR